MPIGTPRVLIGPLTCRASLLILVPFGLFFRDFLSWELHLDVFLTRILKLIPFILIIRCLKPLQQNVFLVTNFSEEKFFVTENLHLVTKFEFHH